MHNAVFVLFLFDCFTSEGKNGCLDSFFYGRKKEMAKVFCSENTTNRLSTVHVFLRVMQSCLFSSEAIFRQQTRSRQPAQWSCRGTLVPVARWRTDAGGAAGQPKDVTSFPRSPLWTVSATVRYSMRGCQVVCIESRQCRN